MQCHLNAPQTKLYFSCRRLIRFNLKDEICTNLRNDLFIIFFFLFVRTSSKKKSVYLSFLLFRFQVQINAGISWVVSPLSRNTNQVCSDQPSLRDIPFPIKVSPLIIVGWKCTQAVSIKSTKDSQVSRFTDRRCFRCLRLGTFPHPRQTPPIPDSSRG